MYTGGDKVKQIQQLKEDIELLEKRVMTDSITAASPNPLEMYYRKIRAKRLKKKKRKLGRLEKQLRH